MKRLLLILALAFLTGCFGAVANASAEPIVVTSTGDGADSFPGDYLCADSQGGCTLRAATEEGAAQYGEIEITFAPSFNGQPNDRILISRPIVIGPESHGVRFDLDGGNCGATDIPRPCVWVGYASPSAQNAIVAGPGGSGHIHGLAIGNALAGFSVAGGFPCIQLDDNWFGLGLDASPTPNTYGILIGETGCSNIVQRNHVAGGVIGISSASTNGLPSLVANTIGVNPLTGAPTTPPSTNGIIVRGNGGGFLSATVRSNVISMQGGIGLSLTGASAAGNYIGVAPDGRDLGGSRIGIQASNAGPVSANTVGNATGVGISIPNSGFVFGNYVGTDSAGRDHGNGGAGIILEAPAVAAPFVFSSIIGQGFSGSLANAPNIISHNGGDAIDVVGTANDDVTIGPNLGVDNDGIFIDLGADGPGNPTGVNGGVAAPRINSVSATQAHGFSDRYAEILLYTSLQGDTGDLTTYLGTIRADTVGRWNVSYPPLPRGTEIAAVQEARGRTSEVAVRAVDLDPPRTRIKARRTAKRGAQAFRLSSSDPGSRFLCAVDKAKLKSCRSSVVLRHLASGGHTLRAAAIDPAGNRDLTPARTHFTVAKR